MITAVNGQLSNIERFYNKGIEFEAGYQILNNLNLDMNYSYLYLNKRNCGGSGT